eukprot:14010791-Heterocapsa_arctica.AAC.1
MSRTSSPLSSSPISGADRARFLAGAPTRRFFMMRARGAATAGGAGSCSGTASSAPAGAAAG